MPLHLVLFGDDNVHHFWEIISLNKKKMPAKISMWWENDAMLRVSFIYSRLADSDNKAMESTSSETI